MIVTAPKDKKEFLTTTEYSLSDILVDLSQLLVILTNYDGLEDDDMLLDITSMINRNYAKLTTAELIVKGKIKDLKGEQHDCI